MKALRWDELSRAVTGTVVALTLLAGLCYYSLPIYLSQLTNERGLPVNSISGGTSIVFIVGSLVGLPVGRWVTHHDPRPLLVASGVFGGASIIILGQATQVWQAYVGYAVMGVGYLSFGVPPAVVAVLRHATPKGRARTLAVATGGTAIGGIVCTPLLSLAIDQVGLSTATAVLGTAFILILSGISVFVMPASPPRHVTVEPAAPAGPVESDSDVASQTTTTPVRRDVTLSQATHNPTLWLIFVTTACFTTAQVGAISHIVRLCTNRGIGMAAVVVPVVTGAALASRFIGAWILGRISLWPWVVSVCALQATSTVVLSVAHNASVILLGSLLFGLALGNSALMNNLLVVETFGMRDFPMIAALQGIMIAIGGASGPIVVSIVFEGSGYGLAYLTMTIINVVGIGAALLASGAARQLDRTTRLVTTQTA